MKIGIDVSQLAYPGSGVASYTYNLVDNLLKHDKENEYDLFFSSLRKKPQVNWQIKKFSFPPILLELLWNQLHQIPIEKFVGQVDVFHTSDWLEPPAKCPKVTTIHDLAIFKHPETFFKKGGHDIISNMMRKLEWVKKESQFIIAVSENTKKDIIDILKIPENKIKVVYEAAEKIYQPVSLEEIEKTKLKYRINGKYLLTVGTREPRKNLIKVLEAYKLLGNDNLNVVLAGNYGWGEDIADLHLEITNLNLLGYVPKEDLVALYSGAEVFAYPSLYEGFGLPVLEAMACGCPVVTSNVSSLPEVAGSAAILIDPLKTEEIKEGIEEALKRKSELSKKSLAQAAKFSWEKTAEETLKIYKEVYADRH